VRQELLSALQMANEQLQRAVDRLGERRAPDPGAQRASSDGQPSGAGAEQAASGQTPESTAQGESGVANPDKGTDRSSMDPATENRQEVHPTMWKPHPPTPATGRSIPTMKPEAVPTCINRTLPRKCG
jgi:hypothetical protein